MLLLLFKFSLYRSSFLNLFQLCFEKQWFSLNSHFLWNLYVFIFLYLNLPDNNITKILIIINLDRILISRKTYSIIMMDLLLYLIYDVYSRAHVIVLLTNLTMIVWCALSIDVSIVLLSQINLTNLCLIICISFVEHQRVYITWISQSSS